MREVRVQGDKNKINNKEMEMMCKEFGRLNKVV